MKNQLIASLCLCLFSLAGWAQSSNLSSDRPGATFSPLTVGQGVVQVQSGVDYTQNVFDPINYPNQLNRPTEYNRSVETISTATDLRVGLLSFLEFSASFYTSSSILTNDFTGVETSRPSPLNPILAVAPALRATLLNNKNFQLGLMASYLTTEDGASGLTSRLMAGYAINNNFSITSNISHTVDIPSQNFDVNTFGYTLNLGYTFNKLTLFVENYGSLMLVESNQETTEHFITFFNVGAYYLLTQNIQLDFTLNYGDNGETFYSANPQFIGVQQTGASLGLTWRFFAN